MDERQASRRPALQVSLPITSAPHYSCPHPAGFRGGSSISDNGVMVFAILHTRVPPLPRCPILLPYFLLHCLGRPSLLLSRMRSCELGATLQHHCRVLASPSQILPNYTTPPPIYPALPIPPYVQCVGDVYTNHSRSFKRRRLPSHVIKNKHVGRE